ncbi:hypothetical protein DUNSADRAFT_7850 [Dunaliella salina]|uniref:Encoded protein n=1 Tax=Dunaliella salina TaxID=3046 RepID=A0ABQ7GKI7_DUNSA|nr:hypothetical protein DUNSADRAFT_7850 [Dunaliella salina]|eukprot:KAF5835131.1 hypothetical protein DUNSADRAFT_7850 [Dunaliella salina]
MSLCISSVCAHQPRAPPTSPLSTTAQLCSCPVSFNTLTSRNPLVVKHQRICEGLLNLRRYCIASYASTRPVIHFSCSFTDACVVTLRHVWLL